MISGVIAVLLGGYWGASLLQCIVLYSSVGSGSVILVSVVRDFGTDGGVT
ncbi:hypothetical protein HGF13_06900 [Rhodobacteraceae bacterium R_SAG5]|nr:hypothetical protein SCH4B_3639 [Ruegeria sp. TrichCH4B]NKX39293.1 hypothetical protein [Rhodobacteraceae bacterium R_SAG5]GLP88798.1 hypothetical protein GCM10007921_43610 [Tritonibacter mobilis]